MSIFDKLEVRTDVPELFQLAINKGKLSENEKSDKYAGNYMYMYSKGGKHYFKNIDTRKYINI